MFSNKKQNLRNKIKFRCYSTPVYCKEYKFKCFRNIQENIKGHVFLTKYKEFQLKLRFYIKINGKLWSIMKEEIIIIARLVASLQLKLCTLFHYHLSEFNNSAVLSPIWLKCDIQPFKLDLISYYYCYYINKCFHQ